MFLGSTANLFQRHWKAGCHSFLIKPLALTAQDGAVTRLFLWCAERQLGNWLGRNRLGSVARSKTNRPLAYCPSLSGVTGDAGCWLGSLRPNLQSACLFLAHFLFCHHPISSPSHQLPSHPAHQEHSYSLEKDQLQCLDLCCPTRKCTAYIIHIL